MESDARRTIVILGDQVDLFAALRPVVESALLQAWWAPLPDADRVLQRCARWPWGIGGTGPLPEAGWMTQLIDKPVLWFWLGDLPASLPVHGRGHDRWPDLAADVNRCAARSVAGVRLAANRGLIGPAGQLVLSAALEGLLSSSPEALRLPPRALRSAARAIQRHRLPLRLVSRNGETRLEALN
jgi:hypothetical protein